MREGTTTVVHGASRGDTRDVTRDTSTPDPFESADEDPGPIRILPRPKPGAPAEEPS